MCIVVVDVVNLLSCCGCLFSRCSLVAHALLIVVGFVRCFVVDAF